jgi:hypothetical protein
MTPDSDVLMVTVTVSTTCLQDVLSALTVFLLRGQYAFLQTFYDAHHMVFEIDVPPHVSGIRLHLQATADEGKFCLSTPSLVQPQPAALTALIQHLQAVCARLGVALTECPR